MTDEYGDLDYSDGQFYSADDLIDGYDDEVEEEHGEGVDDE